MAPERVDAAPAQRLEHLRVQILRQRHHRADPVVLVRLAHEPVVYTAGGE